MIKQTCAKSTLDPVLQNTLLESFLIYSRNLYSFFTESERRRHRDESIAVHYCADWDTKLAKSKMPQMKKSIRDIHQYVAHLSYERERKVMKLVGKRDWANELTITPSELKAVWNYFLTKLNMDFKSNFKEWKSV